MAWKKHMTGVFKGARSKNVLFACSGKDTETLNMFTDWNMKMEKI
jgi:hypothetical protein